MSASQIFTDAGNFWSCFSNYHSPIQTEIATWIPGFIFSMKVELLSHTFRHVQEKCQLLVILRCTLQSFHSHLLKEGMSTFRSSCSGSESQCCHLLGMSLGRLCNLPEPQFPPLRNGNSSAAHNTGHGEDSRRCPGSLGTAHSTRLPTRLAIPVVTAQKHGHVRPPRSLYSKRVTGRSKPLRHRLN